MNRRHFLKTGGFLTVSATLLPRPDLYASVSRLPRGGHVLILGAGFAGLAAAYDLHKRGISFTVLEGRNRIGGRVFTQTVDDSGLHTELGAEWVGASHDRLQNLCKELGLQLLNHQFDTHLNLSGVHSSPSQWRFSEAWERQYLALLEKFRQSSEKQNRRLDQLDFWRYLLNQGIPERDLEIRELLDSTDFGESIRQVSAYVGLSEYAYSSPKNEMDYRVEGGNSQVAKALLATIGTDKVLLNKKAKRIVQAGKIVTVHCEDGSQYSGQRLICTAPTLAVSQLQWEPALPPGQVEALHELQYARIIKSAVVYSQRFWQDEAFDMITDTPAHYLFHSGKNQPGPKGVLTAYAAGDKAYLFSRMNP